MPHLIEAHRRAYEPLHADVPPGPGLEQLPVVGKPPLAIIETDPFIKPTRTPTDGVDAYWSLIEQRGVSADHLPAEY